MSKSIMVATANPFNKQAAADLEASLKHRLLWYLATPADLMRVWAKPFVDFYAARQSHLENASPTPWSRTAVDGAQVEELLEKQKKEGTRFIKLVVEKAYVTENDLVVSMGRVLNTPPVNVARLGIAPEVAELVPRDMANNYKVLPVSRLGNRLYLAMADPLNVLAVDDVKRTTKLEVSPLIASEKAIVDKLANLDTSRSTTMEDIIQDAAKQAEAEADAENLEVAQEAAETTDLAQLAASSEEAPVIKLANLILVQAIKDRASDIHIEPFENMVRLRYRMDGALMDMPPPPKNLQVALTSRIKVMSSLDIAERRLPQDGRMRVRVGGRDVDLRVSFLPTVHGEKCVLRVLDKSNLSASMDKLGIDAETYVRFKRRWTRRTA
jgi:type IV pilus assembly protein PilB